MFDVKTIIGALAVVIGLYGYVPYLRDVFKGTTKPHLFSWLGWTIIQVIACIASLSRGGGAGAWFIGIAALLCAVVTVCSLFRGEKNITVTDWACFIAALIGIAAWVYTSDPLWAVILVSIADAFSFIPTFRKSFMHPEEETLLNYLCAAGGNGLAIFAISSYSVTTWLYPATLVVTNLLFVALVTMRRKTTRRYA